MGYLDRLKLEKRAKEQFDKDTERMKVAVLEIGNLVSLHDGEFLNELEMLINKWKNEK